jgi:hypothetical protein
MRDGSNRVEFVAIPVIVVLLGTLFVLMLAAEAGVWAWIVATAALAALGLLTIALVVRRHPHPSGDDAPPPAYRSPTNGTYRILVIADESLTDQALRYEIVPHAAACPVEALVIAPALRSRLAHWTGDDSQRDRAEQRLAETLEGLEAAGIVARGKLGSDDPIQAADDGLREFPADEVVFVTATGSVNWLERDVLDAARARYAIRVTHVEVGSRR